MIEFISRYWLTFAFGIIGTAITASLAGWRKKWKKKVEEDKTISNGLRSLLRDRIIQAYNYYMDKGYFPIYAREAVEDMYTQYHALNGNGTITHLYSELEELPTDDPEKRRKIIKKEV